MNPPLPDLQLCIVQTHLAWNEPEKNLSNLAGQLQQIDRPVDLIVLPEMFPTAFVMNPPLIAESMDGMSCHWMQEQAVRYGAMIIGSICIKEHNHYYNRLLAVSPDGKIATYDKRHLFKLAGEAELFMQGNQTLIIDLKGWKIKPLICYDLRFPVWSRNRFNAGIFDYDCLVYVANWPVFRSYVWKSLLVARAMENQAYTIGVNRIGRDGNDVPHSGDSAVLDPRGKSLYTAPPNTEVLQILSLSYRDLIKARKDIDIAYDWDPFLLSQT